MKFFKCRTDGCECLFSDKKLRSEHEKSDPHCRECGMAMGVPKGGRTLRFVCESCLFEHEKITAGIDYDPDFTN